MKFTITQKDFLTVIAAASVATEKKNTIPTLTFLLLRAEGDKLVVTGTDLDTTITHSVNAEVDKKGAICLNAEKLLGIAKLLPKDEVAVSVDGSKATITCGGSKFKLPGFLEQHFPTINEATTPLCTLPHSFIQMLSIILASATKEESRYALNGAKLEVKDGVASLTSTDGHRLTHVKTEVTTPTAFQGIIPKKALEALLRMATGDVEVFTAPDHLKFKTGDTSLTTRLIAGQFPAYEAIMPVEHATSITAHRTSLLAAIKKAAIMADERSRAIDIAFEQNIATISSQASDVGDAKIECPVTYTGDPFKGRFNAAYWIDYLSMESVETVAIKTSSPVQQWEINPLNAPHATRFIIMPMAA